MHSKGQEHVSPGVCNPTGFAPQSEAFHASVRACTNAYTQRPDPADHALHMHSFINLRAIRRFFPFPSAPSEIQPTVELFNITPLQASREHIRPFVPVTSFRNHGGWVSGYTVNVGYRSRIQNSVPSSYVRSPLHLSDCLMA